MPRLIGGAILLGAVLATGVAAQPSAGARAEIREYRRVFPTYPFGDPNPIPVVGRIYPYFRFDGFDDRSVPKEWKVVELSNDYLSVMILPEIGGKIWTAIEKRTGKPFIYFNQAVKFRDIAMRGPWTSGGIEANYGIIGHTPNVATPVDYLTRRNPDGSVSCVIGALDLLTETPWRLEIRLAPDQAYFTTSSFWYNGSPLEQPYYTWMNAGIKASGNLQFVYPGSSYLGHGGEHASWPVGQDNGRDLSWYRNNDFGGYKSYHVFGRATDFFGAYWHDDDFGMVRYAPRDEKPGKKIWIWGLSRQGMIWEDLLTDTDGQYVEVQSGRLFNQSDERSTLTPFKHRGFTPHTADRWTESWYPVVGTKGFVVAGQAGALNVTRRGDWLVVALSPVEPLDDSLIVSVAGRRLAGWRVERKPLELFVDSVAVAVGGEALVGLTVALRSRRIEYRADGGSAVLARPVESPADFDWQSGYGRYLRGKEWLRQREYQRAAADLDSSLLKEPHFVPALADRAMLALRARRDDDARRLTMIALSIDSYDGAANYYYGLANRRLGRSADAKDGFEIAAASPDYRSAASTELAKIWMAEGNDKRAADHAEKALSAEPGNLDALGILAVAARRAGDQVQLTERLTRLEAVDPLSQVARFERLVSAGDPEADRKLLEGIRSELPEQTLFDLARWYLDVGDPVSGRRVLAAIGDHPEALYWLAALTPGDPTLIDRATRLSPRLVFPFRREVLAALEGAVARTSHWKPRYYLALGNWAAGRVAEASRLLQEVGDQPDYGPFYAARANLPGRPATQALGDLVRASTLDSTEWRFGKALAERALEFGDSSLALSTAARYARRFPANYILGLTRAKVLVATGRYREADTLLGRLVVLPYEGAGEGRTLYREAKLMVAVEAIARRRWAEATRAIAAAREWPERLGAGKPYPSDVDERLEDWLLADVFSRSGKAAQAGAIWQRLAESTIRSSSPSDALPIWALRRLAREAEATVRLASLGGAAGAALAGWVADPGSLDKGMSGDGTVLRRWFSGGGVTGKIK